MEKKWKKVEHGTWKPENKGDQITGVLISRTEKQEEVSAKYYIENPEGTHLVWGTAILDDRMQHVNVGQEVRITYDGQGKNSKGQKLHHFTVEIAETGESEEAVKPDTEPDLVPSE